MTELFDILIGECLDSIRHYESDSIDSIVTDPPAGISFMGKDWDGDKGGRDEWIDWMSLVAMECLRVIKPGGHAFVWAIPRTSHWTGMAWEKAGWEVRDKVYHAFGSGFPKSKNFKDEESDFFGWGTALKPAIEEWWLFRKPISEKTIVDNVNRWGTGAINIDSCRVEINEDIDDPRMGGKGNCATGKMAKNVYSGGYKCDVVSSSKKGRWPANFVHDNSDEVSSMFPITAKSKKQDRGKGIDGDTFQNKNGEVEGVRGHDDSGGRASRYFNSVNRDLEDEMWHSILYHAKASKKDKSDGLDCIEKKGKIFNGKSPSSSGNAPGIVEDKFSTLPSRNHHPTVKSTGLMRHLCKLTTPPGGIVFDPFTGSGSTGKAAILEGFLFYGIEINEEYANIAKLRCLHAQETYINENPDNQNGLPLFSY